MGASRTIAFDGHPRLSLFALTARIPCVSSNGSGSCGTGVIAQESGAEKSPHRSIVFVGPSTASGKPMTLVTFYLSPKLRDDSGHLPLQGNYRNLTIRHLLILGKRGNICHLLSVKTVSFFTSQDRSGNIKSFLAYLDGGLWVHY